MQAQIRLGILGNLECFPENTIVIGVMGSLARAAVKVSGLVDRKTRIEDRELG